VDLRAGEVAGQEDLGRFLEPSAEAVLDDGEGVEQRFVLGTKSVSSNSLVSCVNPYPPRPASSTATTSVGTGARSASHADRPMARGSVWLDCDANDAAGQAAEACGATVEQQPDRGQEGDGQHERSRDADRGEHPSVARKSTGLARLVRNPMAVAAVHSSSVKPTVRDEVVSAASGCVAGAEFGAVAREQVDREVDAEPDDQDRHDLGLGAERPDEAE
jgi:hypothetical protein